MVMYMMHTGSEDVGFYVGNRWVDKAKIYILKELSIQNIKYMP